MDLTDDQTKREFSLFINERKRQLNLTNESLAGKLGWSVRTVQRYMGMHNNDGELQGVIPDKSYIDLLTALGADHGAFEAFRAAAQVKQHTQDATAHAPAQSNGAGSVQIGSIQISGNARVDNPVIGAQNVTIHVAGKARERGGQ